MKLYHGSSHKIDGALKPTLKEGGADYVHTVPTVFATERLDVAALFMFPFEKLHSIGFEQGIAYICIWGLVEEMGTDPGGYVYVLPPETFERIGKDYEYQSKVAVTPQEVLHFASVVDGMVECGVQVYFINDEAVFDRIVADKNNRLPILRELVSENQKRGLNVKVT